MRFTLSTVLAGGLAGFAMAEDLLFKEGMLFREYTEATTTLGYTGEHTRNRRMARKAARVSNT